MPWPGIRIIMRSLRDTRQGGIISCSKSTRRPFSRAEDDMAKRRKKAYSFIIVLVILAVIAAGVYMGWKKYTSRIEYRLGKAGYTETEVTQIKDLFSEAEQETLAALSAVKGMITVAQDPRYQEDRFVDYLSGFAEGKDAETLLTDLDPLVISLRATEDYKEENLQLYIKEIKQPAYLSPASDPGMYYKEVVHRINMELEYAKVDGYDPALFDVYEAWLAKHPDVQLSEAVGHVNTAQIYKDEPYYIDAYLAQYENYRAEHPDYALYDIILAVNAGIDKPFYTDTKHADMSKGYLILVNKFYWVDDSDKPETAALSGYGVGEMEATAAEWFKKMVDGARADGISLRSVNAYRTEAIQNLFYSGYVRDAGRAAADTYSARPGHSEHQAGLAVDINTASISQHFENSREYAWLVEHCAEYGFILRYLPGKQYITGYVYEPWHYRYVGTEYSKAIMDSGLTFEEWYAYYVANPDNQ